jgi:hypothetical protein
MSDGPRLDTVADDIAEVLTSQADALRFFNSPYKYFVEPDFIAPYNPLVANYSLTLRVANRPA